MLQPFDQLTQHIDSLRTHLQAASVNHEADIGNGQTCLCYVGRDDDFADSTGRFAEGPALVCRRDR